MSDRGSASLALIGVMGLVLVLAVGLAAVGAYLRARVEASTAADAAALAAAPITFLPFGSKGPPVDEAIRFARLNGARVVLCMCERDQSWEPRTVEVTTERTVEIWPLGVFTVRATGRAEFVPALLLDP
ncbi:MAG TPA: Rv3654c family TadE-like protein [Acidimicrobiia bacterium]|nr:Rv3654c family TadE-like protein [Acidimicrobiia bacterium]